MTGKNFHIQLCKFNPGVSRRGCGELINASALDTRCQSSIVRNLAINAVLEHDPVIDMMRWVDID